MSRPKITAVFKDLKSTTEFVVLTDAKSPNKSLAAMAVHAHKNKTGNIVGVWAPCLLKTLEKNSHLNREIKFNEMPKDFQDVANDALDLYEKHSIN